MKYPAIVLAFMLTMVGSTVLAADFAIITNKSTPDTVLSADQIKNYYLGKRTAWSDGTKVTVYTQGISPVHADFIRQIVRKTPQQYTTYWKKSLFTGTGLPPEDFASDAEMKKAVAANPGTLGYISASALDDSVKKLGIN